MKAKHIEEGKYSCKYCEFKSNYIGKCWEHTMNVHEDSANPFTPKEASDFILNVVVEQTRSVYEELQTIKMILKMSLVSLLISLQP